MLLTVSGPGFPSLDRRTRKKAAKWMPDASLYRGGQASTTLANLMARLMEQLDGRLTEHDEVRVSRAHHRRLYKALEDFYPIENQKGLISCAWPSSHAQAEPPAERGPDWRGGRIGVLAGAASRRRPQPGPPPGSDPARLGTRLLHQHRDLSGVSLSARARLRTDPRLGDRDRDSRPTATLTGFRAQQLDAWRHGMRAYMEYAVLDSAAADARGETPVDTASRTAWSHSS